MPPKSTKKTPPGPGAKRGARAPRGTPRSAPLQNNPPPTEPGDEVKVEEIKAGNVIEPEPVIVTDLEPETEAGPVIESKSEQESGLQKEDIVKELVDEYERDEQLDLEDNEHGYEPEEDGGVDYDEKELDPEEVLEEGDDVEEMEGDVDEEEDADTVGDEIEEVQEELEDEEDEENAGEEHTNMVDVEELEHHDVVQERRKRKEFEVFVGGLDKDATEDDLRKVFSEVGEITEVRLMMNPHTKKNKGFAFLRFATVEQAKRACTELKSPMVNGKKCGVSPSQDSDTLFLGNICKTWTKEALKDKLKHYGVENVEDVTLIEDGKNEGSNRGFAFLEFSSRSEAMDAFKLLQKRDVVFGVDKPAKVSFADSFINPGDEIMAQVTTVFVDCLHPSWDQDRVKELLKSYGNIEKIELARDMPSAKRKDFGFVTFDTHDAAVKCAESINNQELGDGEKKAKLRARLSRPLQRGKGKHGTRDHRPPHGSARSVRAPWSRPSTRSLPVRGVRGRGIRLPPLPNRGLKRPSSFRESRRPVMSRPVRGRPLPPPPRSYERRPPESRRPVMSRPVRGRPLPPPPRSYERRPPVPLYPKGSIKRDHARYAEAPPRRRTPEYTSRLVPERRPSYREEYSPRGPGGGSGYPDLPRPTSRTSARRPYVDEGYGPRYERPPPSYREGRGRDYDVVSGSKRSYSAIDEVSPRYADAGVRHSRARLDYDLGGSGSHYADGYSDRLGRPSVEYGSSRTSLSSQDSHGLYSSRHGMSGYSGSSLSGRDVGGRDVGGRDVGGMYSSSYDGDYVSRGSDVGRDSYSSMYSSRSLGGSSSYMGSGSSRSYY